jgi:hypothetical protein
LGEQEQRSAFSSQGKVVWLKADRRKMTAHRCASASYYPTFDGESVFESNCAFYGRKPGYFHHNAFFLCCIFATVNYLQNILIQKLADTLADWSNN